MHCNWTWIPTRAKGGRSFTTIGLLPSPPTSSRLVCGKNQQATRGWAPRRVNLKGQTHCLRSPLEGVWLRSELSLPPGDQVAASWWCFILHSPPKVKQMSPIIVCLPLGRSALQSEQADYGKVFRGQRRTCWRGIRRRIPPLPRSESDPRWVSAAQPPWGEIFHAGVESTVALLTGCLPPRLTEPQCRDREEKNNVSGKTFMSFIKWSPVINVSAEVWKSSFLY